MAAGMSYALASAIGAAGFLLMGLAEYLVFRRALAGADKTAQELGQSAGLVPMWLYTAVKIQAFVLMPIIGWLLGGKILFSLMNG
jgi:hypothetical protein